ncbi:MAG: CPBP family intramembrane metalloprotease [Butyrivibrio sp.]|nr:CPBP family intramembrane metalloprotease [Muribaculum sp.]MCM1553776.1 CPBP family intramembrane metalloprotease [Butyrivibrio sp.]
MRKTNKVIIILMVIMAALSFTNILNLKVDGETLNLAGLSVILGIIAFFTTRKTNESKAEGLDIKSFAGALRDKRVILFLLMPMLMNILSFLIADLCLPEYIEHLGSRTSFLDASELPKLILELLVMALGEEIAWRAFFQKQASKIMPSPPTLLITSILFAMGHFNFGGAVIVLYDLAFIFINSLFYGLVFKRTDNAWCSALAHFLANVLGVFLLNIFM